MALCFSVLFVQRIIEYPDRKGPTRIIESHLVWGEGGLVVSPFFPEQFKNKTKME